MPVSEPDGGQGSGDRPVGPLDRRDQRWLIYLSAAVAVTGVQLVVPALPAMQRELMLSDSELSLVTSAYLFPSVPVAFLSGLLADRVGRRFVYAGSLLLFGVAGTLVPVVGSSSFPLLLALRVGQGAGFAGILPITITLIGDLFSGPTQVRVQGHRSLSMQTADASLPVLGGLLAMVSWWLPFVAPAAAIVLAGLVVWRFPAAARLRRPTPAGHGLREILGFMRDAALVALVLAGLMRFLVKYVVVSYLPVLAVNEKGVSAFVASLALGAAAAAGGAGALSASRLVNVVPPRLLLAAAVGTMTATLLVMAAAGAVGLLLAAVVFGLADGLFAVLLNAMVAQAVATEARATFVSLAAAFRNLGKFLAPVLAAAIALVGSLSQSFAVAGLFGLLTLAAIPPLARFSIVLGNRDEPNRPDATTE